MIRVSVMYPNKSGARFDHDYYRDVHMPMLQARLGTACRGYAVDKGISGGGPGDAAPYIAACHLFCDSLEAFQQAVAQHAREFEADMLKYTNLIPVIQISEVIVGEPCAGGTGAAELTVAGQGA